MGFFSYLPQDNTDITSAEVVELLNEDLSVLLSSSGAQFWAVAREDASLHACIDSFLLHARRPHDVLSHDTQSAEVILKSHGQQMLRRRMFMVINRMITSEEKDMPAPHARIALLYEEGRLDVSKLLDIGAVYLHSNPTLCGNVVRKIWECCCKMRDELSTVAAQLVDNLSELQERCHQILGAPGQLRPAASSAAQLNEAVAYFMDTMATLLALLNCVPDTAVSLLKGSSDQLFAVLAKLHDELMPEVLRVLHATDAKSRGGAAQEYNANEESASLVQVACQRLAFLLAQHGLLEGRGESAVGTSASSESDPSAVGERVMNALMMMQSTGSLCDPAATLLTLMASSLHLDTVIHDAITEGRVQVDNTQYEYMMALMGISGHAQPVFGSRAHPHEAAQAGTSSGPAPAHPRAPENLASLVSAVTDVLGDYSDAYIEACLQCLGWDSARVVDDLLEGRVPAALEGVDRHCTVNPLNPARDERERGPLTSGAAGPSRPEGSSWGKAHEEFAQLQAGSAALFRERMQAAAPKQPGTKYAGKKASRAFDVSKYADKDAVKSKALESLLWDGVVDAYDDEYDDAFDDLGVGVKDGEVEGDYDEPGFTSQREESTPPRPSKSNKPVYLLDGKIYNYKKDGAIEYKDHQAAEAAKKVASEEILGLGAGGNVPALQSMLASSAKQLAALPGAPDHTDMDSEGYSASSRLAGEQGSSSGRTSERQWRSADRGRGGRSRGSFGGRQGPAEVEHEGGAGQVLSEGGGRGSRGEGGSSSSRGGRGRGFAHKDRNKAAIANHHRKDRAMQKMGM